MAAKDLKRVGINNQKRGVTLMVATLAAADLAADGSIVGELPGKSLITSVRVIENEAVTTSGTIDILVGSTTAYDELAADATAEVSGGVYVNLVPSDVTIKVGASAIAAGNITVLIEYVEYEKTTGEYTN